MNNGRIEQVGTPEQIYRSPASRFVADFVGRANWLPVSMDDAGTASLGELRFRVELPMGKNITAFCRPEDVRIESHWQSGANTTLAMVERVDFHGGVRRAVLSLCTDRTIRILADVSPNDSCYDQLETGRRVPITLPAHKMRFFMDAAT
jgi:iron(III) transport system ATP-binding protein